MPWGKPEPTRDPDVTRRLDNDPFSMDDRLQSSTAMPAPRPQLSRVATISRLAIAHVKHGFIGTKWLRRHDRTLFRSIPVHFDSLSDARRAAGIVERRAIKWSQERVIAELRRMARAGESTTLHDLKRQHSGLWSAVKRYGGIQQLRKLVGIRPLPRPPRTIWSRERILETLRERGRGGGSLSSTKVPPGMVGAAIRIFGSWRAAVAAAGLTPAKARQRYTRREILDQLRRLAREQPALRWSELTRHVSWPAIRRLFGSVEQALRAAKLTNWPIRTMNPITRDSVIAELKERAAAGQYAILARLHYRVMRVFGSIEAARKAAGVEPINRRWTKQRVLDVLHESARTGARIKNGFYQWAPVLFGSVAEARRQAGVPRGWTPGGVIAAIGRRAARKRPAGPALRAAGKRHFGSLDAAYRAAGVARLKKAEILGQICTARRDPFNNNEALIAECRERFGSVAAARRAAGLPTLRAVRIVQGAATRARNDRRFPWRRWSRDVVLEKVRAWHRRGSNMPLPLELACNHQFGTVNRALAELGLEPIRAAWTRQRVITALRDAAPSGGVLSRSLSHACITYFGSVTAAREVAGVPKLMQKSVKRWTRNELIAELQARIRHGLQGTGRILGPPCESLFGSRDAALRAAAASMSSSAKTR